MQHNLCCTIGDQSPCECTWTSLGRDSRERCSTGSDGRHGSRSARVATPGQARASGVQCRCWRLFRGLTKYTPHRGSRAAPPRRSTCCELQGTRQRPGPRAWKILELPRCSMKRPKTNQLLRWRRAVFQNRLPPSRRSTAQIRNREACRSSHTVAASLLRCGLSRSTANGPRRVVQTLQFITQPLLHGPCRARRRHPVMC